VPTPALANAHRDTHHRAFDPTRHAFNLSVAEMNEGGTLWNQATVGVAVISSSMQSLTQHLESIAKAAHRITLSLSAEIADSYAEILND
jgi:uncharacterized protein YlxP (DUF503 family)